MSCFVFQCIKVNYNKDVQNRAIEFLGIAEHQPVDIHQISEAMADLSPLLGEGRGLPGREDVVRFIRVIATIMVNQVDIPHPPEPPRLNEHVHEWFGRDDSELNDGNLTQFVGEDGRTVDPKEIYNSLRQTGPQTPGEFFANFMTMLLVQSSSKQLLSTTENCP
ncbi:unnamed protein product [Cylicocyclus nassatus]|uniref:Uncharacterized protein n=1 Tax=Cylicocyclus nassatus TaxID=53992 RepID=A0AA36DIR4_CYLNA|nr:unnamed protein product [Cylicocyclus nassatus]